MREPTDLDKRRALDLRERGFCGHLNADGLPTTVCILPIGHAHGAHDVLEIARDVIAYKTRSHVGAALTLSRYVVGRSQKLEAIAREVRAILDEEPNLEEPEGLARVRVYESFIALRALLDDLG